MSAAENLARWREAVDAYERPVSHPEFRTFAKRREGALGPLLAFAEAMLALGHVDCPMDPERDPYVGCKCGMSRVYQLAEQHLGGAR